VRLLGGILGGVDVDVVGGGAVVDDGGGNPWKTSTPSG
jgi:hypothetical protein